MDWLMKNSGTEKIDIIRNNIHAMRGLCVIPDFDLATLYRVDTKMLKRAVQCIGPSHLLSTGLPC